MVARRVRLDLLKPLRRATPRENQMAFQSFSPGHQGREPHSHLESNPRLLWNDRHRAGLADDLQESVVQTAHDRLTPGEKRCDVVGTAGVPLTPGCEPLAARGATPQGRPALRSIDGWVHVHTSVMLVLGPITS
jgi:hypothetical protein